MISKALEDVKKTLQSLGFKIEHAEVEFVASNLINLTGEEEQRAHEFLEAVEDLDDVQNLYTNLG